MLEFLCEKCKCDTSVPCNDGLKPIHAASQCGHTKIVKVGLDRATSQHKAFPYSVIQYIVSQLGNQVIFDTTPDGATPLHFATCKKPFLL